MESKIKLPFMFTKKYWTEKGKNKKIAEAKHTLAGEKLERKLVEIEYEGSDKDKEKQLKLLEIDRKYGKINDVEFNKQSATIKDEPYVGVIKTHFDPSKPKNGFFELDWNEKFIENLSSSGYHGEKDEDAVNKWFNDLCKNIMMEDIEQDVLEEMKQNITENKKDIGDGKVEYS